MIIRDSFNSLLKQATSDNVINKSEAELLKENAKYSGEKSITRNFGNDNMNLKFKVREDISTVIDYNVKLSLSDDTSKGYNITSGIISEIVVKGPHNPNPEGVNVTENVYQQYPNLKSLGKVLKIEDYDNNPIVQENVKDLAKVPEGLLVALKEKGLKQIHIASLSSLYLAKNQDLADDKPRNWSEGSTFDDVPGLYEPNDKTVAIGVGDNGSSSLAIHELAHAIGDLLDLDKTKEMKQHHERLFPKLEKYLQGGTSPANKAGMEETFAEGLALLIKDGEEKAIEKFDKPFVDHLKSILEKYSTK